MLVSMLKQCRTAQRMTIKDVSALSGISADTIRRLERTGTVPKLTEIHAICKAIGLPAKAVFPDKNDDVR